jgi:hypothetical protein
LEDVDFDRALENVMALLMLRPPKSGLLTRTCSRCNQPIAYTSGGIGVSVCPNCGIMLHPTY